MTTVGEGDIYCVSELFCTLCYQDLNHPAYEIFQHPLIPVPLCIICKDEIESRLELINVDDGETADICTWCVEGGDLFICDDGVACPFTFCKDCIEHKLGKEKLHEIENLYAWKCFVCDPQCLNNKYQAAFAHSTSISMYSKDLSEPSSTVNSIIETEETMDKNLQNCLARLQVIVEEMDEANKNLETENLLEKEREIREELHKQDRNKSISNQTKDELDSYCNHWRAHYDIMLRQESDLCDIIQSYGYDLRSLPFYHVQQSHEKYVKSIGLSTTFESTPPEALFTQRHSEIKSPLHTTTLSIPQDSDLDEENESIGSNFETKLNEFHALAEVDPIVLAYQDQPDIHEIPQLYPKSFEKVLPLSVIKALYYTIPQSSEYCHISDAYQVPRHISIILNEAHQPFPQNVNHWSISQLVHPSVTKALYHSKSLLDQDILIRHYNLDESLCKVIDCGDTKAVFDILQTRKSICNEPSSKFSARDIEENLIHEQHELKRQKFNLLHIYKRREKKSQSKQNQAMLKILDYWEPDVQCIDDNEDERVGEQRVRQSREIGSHKITLDEFVTKRNDYLNKLPFMRQRKLSTNVTCPDAMSKDAVHCDYWKDQVDDDDNGEGEDGEGDDERAKTKRDRKETEIGIEKKKSADIPMEITNDVNKLTKEAANRSLDGDLFDETPFNMQESQANEVKSNSKAPSEPLDNQRKTIATDVQSSGLTDEKQTQPATATGTCKRLRTPASRHTIIDLLSDSDDLEEEDIPSNGLGSAIKFFAPKIIKRSQTPSREKIDNQLILSVTDRSKGNTIDQFFGGVRKENNSASFAQSYPRYRRRLVINDPVDYFEYIINEERPTDDPAIGVPAKIAGRLKDHQKEALRFIWKNIMNNFKDANRSGTGGGCILAHCMGLGKTLTIIAFTMTLLSHPSITSILHPKRHVDQNKSTPNTDLTTAIESEMKITDTFTSSTSQDKVKSPGDPTHEITSPNQSIPSRRRFQSVLILAPVNTLANWVKEFRMWTPSELLNVANVKMMQSDSCISISQRVTKLKGWYHDGGVLIMGYEMFRVLTSGLIEDTKEKKRLKLAMEQENEIESNPSEWCSPGTENVTKGSKDYKKMIIKYLLDPGPDMVIADEAHLIRNRDSKLSITMNQIKTKRKIALTGSPVQNNLHEYWCMVNWVKPNCLGTRKTFEKLFIKPIQCGEKKEATEYEKKMMKKKTFLLNKRLKSIVHRRDFTTLVADLPPKREFVLSLIMTDVQKYLYKKFISLIQSRINFLFQAYQSLLRVWNHPCCALMMHYSHKAVDNGDVMEERLDPIFTDDAITTDKMKQLSEGNQNKNVMPNCTTPVSKADLIKVSQPLNSNSTKKQKKNLKKDQSLPKKYRLDQCRQDLSDIFHEMKQLQHPAIHPSNPEDGANESTTSKDSSSNGKKRKLSDETGSESNKMIQLAIGAEVFQIDIPTKPDARVDTIQASSHLDPIASELVDSPTTAAFNDSPNHHGSSLKGTRNDPDDLLIRPELTDEVNVDEVQLQGITTDWWKVTKNNIPSVINSSDPMDIQPAEPINDSTFVNMSSKMIALFTLIKFSVEIGDKMLLFSQSLYTLDLIEMILAMKNWGSFIMPTDKQTTTSTSTSEYSKWKLGTQYLRIDGSTKGRQELIDNFNANDNIKIFLLSTKAGNMGINLQSANRIVIIDSSWNPSNDLQAIFRSYRYGQQKPVFVYRLLASGTMEEKIYKRQVSKQALSARVVDAQMPNNAYTEEETSELLKIQESDERSTSIEKALALVKSGLPDYALTKLIEYHIDLFVSIEDHGFLLEDRLDEHLNEEEQKAAEEEFEMESRVVNGEISVNNPIDVSQSNADGVVSRLPGHPMLVDSNGVSMDTRDPQVMSNMLNRNLVPSSFTVARYPDRSVGQPIGAQNANRQPPIPRPTSFQHQPMQQQHQSPQVGIPPRAMVPFQPNPVGRSVFQPQTMGLNVHHPVPDKTLIPRPGTEALMQHRVDHQFGTNAVQAVKPSTVPRPLHQLSTHGDNFVNLLKPQERGNGTFQNRVVSSGMMPPQYPSRVQPIQPRPVGVSPRAIAPFQQYANEKINQNNPNQGNPIAYRPISNQLSGVNRDKNSTNVFNDIQLKQTVASPKVLTQNGGVAMKPTAPNFLKAPTFVAPNVNINPQASK